MALFLPSLIRATDANNVPLSGAKWWFFQTGTLDAVTVYADADLTDELGTSVTADSSGNFVTIYYDDEDAIRAQLKTAAGATIRDIDPYEDDGSSGSGDAEVTIEAFGGAADWNGSTGTDNLQPLLNALDSFTYAPQAAGYAIGPDVLFGPGSYYFSDTIDLKKIVRLIGVGSGQNNFASGTRFFFPVNTTGIRVNVLQTLGGTTIPASTTAEGSVIKGIHLICAAGGSSSTAHAIHLHGRANIENCAIGLIGAPWPGNGINIVANSGGVGVSFGNANCWYINKVYVEDVDGHGLFVSGTDVNAGMAVGFETRLCGGCGVLDMSGLGNSYTGLNIAGYANNSPLKGRVTHGGRNYQLIDPTTGIGASTTPGTNNAIWYDMGAATTWPAWSGSGTYTPDIPILTYGNSNRSTFIGVYTEGGTSHIASPGIAIGGQAGFTNTSGVLHVTGVGVNLGIFSPMGVGGYRSYISGTPGYSTNGDRAYTVVGSPNSDVTYGVNILAHNRQIDGTTEWSWRWNAQKDQEYAFGANKNAFRITGLNTTTTFGRTTAVPYIFGCAKFALIDPDNLNNARIMNAVTAVPSSGECARGERFWLINASASGKLEAVCTTAGTLGSTAVTKTCNPIDA